PSVALEREEDVSRVLTTLGSLPESQREVIRLKFQHGLSYKEIGRVTAQSTGNVGWLLHVGLKTLRERLAGETVETLEESA
ncbi:MAG: sigma-70 family RNA polymerase sigma factor, partial [Planctomycetota bacterium]|nr:sigma-70 family RNA polymerase sigma factor [Planctomycetota bacterium]